MPIPAPDPEDEALQEPTIAPGDFRQFATSLLKVLGGPGFMQILPMLGGLMRKRSPHDTPSYLPPGYELEERFTRAQGPKGMVESNIPGIHSGDLHTGDQLMRLGIDPHGPGMQRTWAPQNAMFDYMPQQVKDYPTATRYTRNYVGRTSLDPYGPNTDDGVMGTARFWQGRDSRLGYGE